METEANNPWPRVLFLWVTLHLQYYGKGDPQVPCYFIFGDSLADSGNNNPLITLAKVNFQPYGVDFPTGATGRFTNGLTALDALGQILGFDTFMPPFSSAFSYNVFRGVNYASGSAGILEETGGQLGDHIPFDTQLQNHEFIVNYIKTAFGPAHIYNGTAEEYLSKCLYAVIIGNNDYINNYFVPTFYPSSYLYTPEQFANLLIEQYTVQITSLYDMGARKLALFGVANIGCTPNAISLIAPNKTTGCVERMNEAAHLFNQKLRAMVDQFNANLSDARFTMINVSGLQAAVQSDPVFKVKDSACCKLLLDIVCIPFAVPCSNRSEYFFWDSYHPTEAADRMMANRAYKAVDPTDSYPYDIKCLIAF